MNHLARNDVRLNGFDKRYELQVSLFQLGVLLVFNGGDSFPLRDILEATKLNQIEFVKNVKVGASW